MSCIYSGNVTCEMVRFVIFFIVFLHTSVTDQRNLQSKLSLRLNGQSEINSHSPGVVRIYLWLSPEPIICTLDSLA